MFSHSILQSICNKIGRLNPLCLLLTEQLNTHHENKFEMVGYIAGVPWWFRCDHLNNNTAYTPHITSPAIMLSSQYLTGHIHYIII